MKILIIGAGYVGQAVARFQKEKGHAITCTIRSEDKIPLLKAFGEVQVWDSSIKIDHDVVLFSVAANSPQEYQTAYLENAIFLRKALKPPTHLIYTSSTSVYAEDQGGEVDETASLKSHLLTDTENVLLAYPHTTILRLGEIVGPGREIVNRLKKGGTLAGTGANFANLSHLEDIVSGVNWVICKELRGIYNLCASVHPTRRELYEEIARKHKLQPLRWDSSQKPSHGTSKRVLSHKIEQTGFSFLHNTLNAFI